MVNYQNYIKKIKIIIKFLLIDFFVIYTLNYKIAGDTVYYRAEGATTRKLSCKRTAKRTLWKMSISSTEGASYITKLSGSMTEG